MNKFLEQYLAKNQETRPTHTKLGRYVNHDERSKQYGAVKAPAIRSVDHTCNGLPLDQGNIGSCTANAAVAALMCDPNYYGGVLDEKFAQNLYHLETTNEGEAWPPNDPGGSGLEIAKVLKSQSLIRSYTHAFGIQHALEALTLQPVITGIDWMSSFDHPDKNGLVKLTASSYARGGHEIAAVGIDVPKRLVWFWNSWGPTWGKSGKFAMSWDTWGTLLARQGDVTVFVI